MIDELVYNLKANSEVPGNGSRFIRGIDLARCILPSEIIFGKFNTNDLFSNEPSDRIIHVRYMPDLGKYYTFAALNPSRKNLNCGSLTLWREDAQSLYSAMGPRAEQIYRSLAKALSPYFVVSLGSLVGATKLEKKLVQESVVGGSDFASVIFHVLTQQ